MFYKIIRVILIPIIYFLFRPRVYGMENFPLEGKTIVYCNHTSMLDPIIIGCILPRKVRFMAKIQLFKIPILGTVLKHLGAFPVKRGSADLSAIKTSLQILKDEGVFGIFPEGTRIKGGAMGQFSHGIASIAHKSKATIIPIAISNEYKLFRSVQIKIGKALDFDKYFEQKSNNQLLESMSIEMENSLRSLMK